MTSQPLPAAVETPTAKRPRRVWIWFAVLAVLAVAALTLGFYLAFAAFIPDSLTATSGFEEQEIATQELAIARMETQALRNALAATGGLAVLVALAVTIRRQLHHEQSTRESQAAELRRQVSLEDKAARDVEDATQRRITDARIRAVEQLGSDHPAVRIGGLHNLERIGQLYPELRQVILDEVCAYLRRANPTPISTKTAPLPPRQFEPIGPAPVEVKVVVDEDESEIRQIAQEILQRHLRHEDSERWEHSRLNLRNAHLNEIQLASCHLVGADFTNATFTGDADFSDATFTDRASFEGSTFTDRANFTDAIFTGHANLLGSTFADYAVFGGVAFTRSRDVPGTVILANATFTDYTDFRNANFSSSVNVGGVTFTDTVDFSNAEFLEHLIGFGAARIHGTLRATSWTLLEAMQRQGVRLRTGRAHELPEGWAVVAGSTDPGWGRLVAPTATSES